MYEKRGVSKVEHVIEECGDPRSIPRDLLYLADPSDEMLNAYVDVSFAFVCRIDREIVGALLMMPTRPFTVEIMNISVRESYWNQGIGRQLIQGAVKKARETGMKKVEIGTGNPGVVQMLLYQKCGFRITGVEFDYFRRCCAEKIIENGIECRDMIRMEMHLDEEMQKEG